MKGRGLVNKSFDKEYQGTGKDQFPLDMDNVWLLLIEEQGTELVRIRTCFNKLERAKVTSALRQDMLQDWSLHYSMFDMVVSQKKVKLRVLVS